MKRKRIKLNKYQLKSDLTGSIWLAEDDPRSSQNKSRIGANVQLKIRANQKDNTKWKPVKFRFS